MVDLLQKNNVPGLEKLSEITVIFDVMHHTTKTMSREEDILPVLYRMSIEYEFFDPKKQNKEEAIILNGPSWLSKKRQENLLKYIDEGGALLLISRWRFINFESVRRKGAL